MADGALFVLQQPLALLVLLAAGLLLQWCPARHLPVWLALFAAFAALSLLLPVAHWHRTAAPAYLVVAGGWQAAGHALRGLAARIAGAVAGLPFAWAASLAVATPAEALGSVGAGAVLMFAVVAAAALARRVLGRENAWALAGRIVGSWLAAVGLLLVALAIARGR